MTAWLSPCSCICLAEGYLYKSSLPDVPVFACGAKGRDARRGSALPSDGDCHPVAARTEPPWPGELPKKNPSLLPAQRSRGFSLRHGARNPRRCSHEELGVLPSQPRGFGCLGGTQNWFCLQVRVTAAAAGRLCSSGRAEKIFWNHLGLYLDRGWQTPSSGKVPAGTWGNYAHTFKIPFSQKSQNFRVERNLWRLKVQPPFSP